MGSKQQTANSKQQTNSLYTGLINSIEEQHITNSLYTNKTANKRQLWNNNVI